jgi:hypothetical protein
MNINEVASDYRKPGNRRIPCCVYVKLCWNIKVYSLQQQNNSKNSRVTWQGNKNFPVHILKLGIIYTKHSFFTPGKQQSSLIVLAAGWALRSVRRGVKREFRNPTKFRTPNLRACMKSLQRIRLRYPRHMLRISNSLQQFLN